jgi:hypothetical protein
MFFMLDVLEGYNILTFISYHTKSFYKSLLCNTPSYHKTCYLITYLQVNLKLISSRYYETITTYEHSYFHH